MKRHQIIRAMWSRLALLLGTGLGVGFCPIAPGTVGSLWGVVFVWGIQYFQLGVPGLLLVAVAVALVSVPICGQAAESLGQKDPGSVVLDEIAAFPVVFLLVPVGWATAVMGFCLFRVFDIIKPWPVSKLEKLPGGWGIVADDLAAGVYAGALLWGAGQLLQKI